MHMCVSIIILRQRMETRANPCFQKIQKTILLNKIFYILDRFDALISKIFF